jgi:hypothetical protein
MDVSLYTLISPRQDIHFIQEWISHYLSIGFDRIFIYENGIKPLDQERRASFMMCDEMFKHKMWVDARSADKIYKDLNSIVDKYDRVKLVPWHKPFTIRKPFWYSAQMSGLTDCLVMNPNIGWIAFFDADEFLWLKHNNIKKTLNTKLSCVRFNQKVFECRNPRQPVRSITTCAKIENVYKFVAKLSDIRKIDNMHKIGTARKRMQVDDTVGLIAHYRGQSYRAYPLNQTDKRMLKYLKHKVR